MTIQRFLLPDVGEGLEEAGVVTWHVAVGDTVTHNQLLVEIETAKSLVELPSPYEGTVTELLVDEGSTVPVGTPLIAIGVDDGTAPVPAGPAEPAADTSPAGRPNGESGRTEPTPSVRPAGDGRPSPAAQEEHRDERGTGEDPRTCRLAASEAPRPQAREGPGGRSRHGDADRC